MANLTLNGQATKAADIGPKLAKLKQALDARKAIWTKLPIEKKKKWVASEKDPVMTLAFTIGQYLQKNFPELVEERNG